MTKKMTLEKLAEMIQGGFSETEEKFNDIDNRFNGVEKRLDRVENRLDKMGEDMTEIKSAVRRINEIDPLRDRVAVLEKKVR